MSLSPDKHPDRGNFLESSLKLFRYYQSLGEKAIAQLSDEEVLRKPNEESNSIALIVHHLSDDRSSSVAQGDEVVLTWSRDDAAVLSAQ